MVRFPSNSSKKSLKQRLDFPDNKGLQLWSDLLKFEAEQSLKEHRYRKNTISIKHRYRKNGIGIENMGSLSNIGIENIGSVWNIGYRKQRIGIEHFYQKIR